MQSYIFTYHKTGTVLFERILQRLATATQKSFAIRYGRFDQPDPAIDITLFAHSLIRFDPFRYDMRAIRVVRDPRDIWVSGFLYHRRCEEGWCVNTDFSEAWPIGYPRVDFSVIHKRERWKRDYLRSLAGKSYQQNLLDRDTASGLAFELANYTGQTLDAMIAWEHQGPALLQLKMEDFVTDFDGTLRRAYRHLGLEGPACEALIAQCAADDVARMSDTVITANHHIHSRKLSKWRDFLTAEQVQTFEDRYGGLITGLGYQRSGAISDAAAAA
ncbi:MAG: sulfotransferase domain-containing protein [Acetobacteraceae bacterium]|nr:sulfotransferase domain-containing protein [Acetobacteraceae bacterium]